MERIDYTCMFTMHRIICFVLNILCDVKTVFAYIYAWTRNIPIYLYILLLNVSHAVLLLHKSNRSCQWYNLLFNGILSAFFICVYSVHTDTHTLKHKHPHYRWMMYIYIQTLFYTMCRLFLTHSMKACVRDLLFFQKKTVTFYDNRLWCILRWTQPPSFGFVTNKCVNSIQSISL